MITSSSVLRLLPSNSPSPAVSTTDLTVTIVFEPALNTARAAKEGGVRAMATLPTKFVNPLPSVQLFHDADGDRTISAGELAVQAENVVAGADGLKLYYTPPPYPNSGWPALNGRSVAIDAIIQNANGSQFVAGLVAYTEDPVDGVRGTLDGVTTAYQEILENDPAEFIALAPTAGAMAEVILSGVFRRASVSDGNAGVPLVAAVEDFLPALEEWLDTDGQAIGLQPIVRSPAYGQTIHSAFRYGDDPVLMTLGTGTLMLTDPGSTEPSYAPFGGRLVFPQDLPRTELILPSEAKGWSFDLDMTAEEGLQISHAQVFRPDRGVMEYVSPLMSVPQVDLVLGTTEVLFRLDRDQLSHIYIDPHVTAYLADDTLNEWLVAAVYRYNLDGSATQENIAKTALTLRQSFAFSEPHTSFEPAHCLNGSQVYPRVSASLSLPVGDFPPSPPITSLLVDHRIALAPERDGDPNSPDLYVAGAFKDLDQIQLCMPFAGQPAPLWANMFDTLGTEAPVQHEQIFFPGQVDNIHLHHVHPETTCAWCEDLPIVEAPGSFDSFHMHWRWGTEYGAEFGSGEFLYPQNQSWLLGLAKHDFPVDPDPDWFAVLLPRIHGGGGLEITTDEKVLLLRCVQNEVGFHRQYESFSTGFNIGLGPVPNLTCPLIDYITRIGGYYAATVGFGNPVLNFFLAYYDFVLGFLISGPCSSDAMSGSAGNYAIVNGDLPVTSGTGGFCEKVEFVQERLGEQTPLSLPSGLGMVDLETQPPGAMKIASNMLTTSLGYMLSEPSGAAGSVLTITFDPPIRELRQLPMAVNDTVGPSQVRIALMSGKDVLGEVVTTAVVQPPGQFCEGFADLDPGQMFDRITIRSENPTKEFGIGGFQVCGIVIPSGDYNYDGVVNLLDLPAQRICTAGPRIRLGFSCTDPDLDLDGDVDLADFARFQNAQTGP